MDALRDECRRQAESCLYTSTSLHIWLRSARRWRKLFVTAPIVLGGIAGWTALQDQPEEWARWVTALCGLGAGIFPAVFVALNMNMSIEEISRLAAEFSNLRDRFRVAAEFKSHGPPDEFEQVVEDLMDRLDAARAHSVTPPERCFKEAQRKIKSGHYDFEVDSPEGGD